MPLLRTEAEKLSRNQLERGVIEEVLDRDDMFALLPFVGVNGKSYDYNRENGLSSADWLDPNDAVNESSATFTTITTRLKILAGDVDIDKFLSGTLSDNSDQIAIQLAAKAKAVSRAFSLAVATGDSSVVTKSFDGLPKLVTSGQTLTAGTNGASVSLSMIDELKDLVLNGGADAYVMRKGTWRAIKQLMRAAGGNTAEMLQIENFGRPVPAIDGIPVLLNDFLANNETQGSSSVTASIYAVRLNEADGLHGIYGGPGAGFVVENIGTVQNKDAIRLRIKWYAGLALKSTKSIARLKGLTNI